LEKPWEAIWLPDGLRSETEPAKVLSWVRREKRLPAVPSMR
jgi:hypothetical protein